MTTPLGLRRNNPGNLRPLRERWLGETTKPGEPYCSFDSMENGVRALAKNLLTYQDKHKLRTVEKIISRWAPGNENDTEAYIRSVCKRTKFARAALLDLTDARTLYLLTEAIIWHENGETIDDDTLNRGLARALGSRSPH